MKKLLTIAIIICTTTAYTQSNISARLFFTTLNFELEQNKDFYKTKILPDGLMSFEPGINVAYEFFQDEDISLKLQSSIFADHTLSMALNASLMMRFRFYFVLRNYFTIGLGPVIFARNTWERFPNYQNIDKFKTYNNIQYRLWILSGELEYCRILSRNTDFCLSINHIHPYSVTVSGGIKYWFSRKSKKCKTCPSFH